MEIDTDKLFYDAIHDGIREGIKAKFARYNSPLDALAASAIKKHESAMRGMLEEAIGGCVDDAVFRNDVKTSLRSHLARLLVQRFGGEIEKQVNVLKSDPTTRARITLAIEEIVKSSA